MRANSSFLNFRRGALLILLLAGSVLLLLVIKDCLSPRGGGMLSQLGRADEAMIMIAVDTTSSPDSTSYHLGIIGLGATFVFGCLTAWAMFFACSPQLKKACRRCTSANLRRFLGLTLERNISPTAPYTLSMSLQPHGQPSLATTATATSTMGGTANTELLGVVLAT